MKIYYEVSPDPRVQEFNHLIKTRFPTFLSEKDPEMILVAGGDGAMHHATKRFPGFKGIYFGKGLGTLNFLMNTFDDDVKTITKLKRDELFVHTVETATISIILNEKIVGSAANDLVIGDSVNGYHTYTLNTEDHAFENFTFKGTGLCLSTPLGSTGYGFNNGGVILPLDSNLWTLTGIVCNKYINDVLTAQKTTLWATGGKLYIDGIDAGTLTNQDTLVMTPGNPIRIGFLDPQVFSKRRTELANRMRKGSM